MIGYRVAQEVWYLFLPVQSLLTCSEALLLALWTLSFFTNNSSSYSKLFYVSLRSQALL